MGQFSDLSIKNVVEELNVRYFLPDIQREYVWLNNTKEKKIENLFDSILRGYPIGSFLFWKLNKEDIETNKDVKEDSKKLNFQLYKFVENYHEEKTEKADNKVRIDQINRDEISIVLDGQQRLTSLYLGLKGSRTLKKTRPKKDDSNPYEEKYLYINLRYQPKEDEPDDNFMFEFHNTPPPNDSKNYWYKVGDVLKLESLVNYARNNALSDTEVIILEKLHFAICTKSLISFFEEPEKNLDKVLKIFIRVNSGGTKLSHSDLLMSILTANFSKDIRSDMKILIGLLKDEGFECMGRDQVLKTCLILTECNHVFKLNNFSKSNINKIEVNWEKITEAIFSATKLLKEFGYKNRLSSGYILSVIAHFIYRKEKITQSDKEEMLRFVRNAQIKSYFTTATDGKISIVADILKESTTFEEINSKMVSSKQHPLTITRDDVERMLNLEYGNPAIMPVLQVLYPHLDFKNSTFHIDHIYPKSKFDKKSKDLPVEYLKKANFLFNLQLLQGEDNLNKSDKDPEVWIKEHFQNDVDKISIYKERNYIDKDFVLEWNNIEDFETQRSEKLQNALEVVFGFSKDNA